MVGVGSFVSGPTFAVFVMPPPAGAVTTTVRFVTWLFVSAPKFHVTRPPFVAPPPVAPTKITFAGSVSVTTTLLASDGPRFVTLMV